MGLGKPFNFLTKIIQQRPLQIGEYKLSKKIKRQIYFSVFLIHVD